MILFFWLAFVALIASAISQLFFGNHKPPQDDT